MLRIKCFVQHSEKEVELKLQKERGMIKEEVVNLSDRIFPHQYFNKDRCPCACHKKIMGYCLEFFRIKLTKEFRYRPINKANFLVFMKINFFIKQTFLLVLQGECVVPKILFLVLFFRKQGFKSEFNKNIVNLFSIFFLHNLL